MQKTEKVVIAPVDYKSLNKFLMGTLAEIKRGEIDIEVGIAIARVSDVIVKNNITKIKYDEVRGHRPYNDFFDEAEKYTKRLENDNV